MFALFENWGQLTTANQVFFGIAAFFSVLFIWQFLMTLLGLAGQGDAEVGGDMDPDILEGAEAAGTGADGGEHDTTSVFRLLSLRAIVTAGMLFGWAGALYLYNGVPMARALLYAVIWALAGAVVVTFLLSLMRRLQETGTPRLATCVGHSATVYMDIPAGGTGKVRTVVSGAVSFVSARGAGGLGFGAGTPVRITRLQDPVTVEVAPLEPTQGENS